MVTVLTDASPWEQRATWWSPTWRYRLPVTVTAGVDLVDGVATVTVNWTSVLAALGIVGTVSDIDAASLRLIEYTPGGHVTTPALTTLTVSSLSIQRFDRCPVVPYRGNVSDLRALVPGLTANGVVRYFFLYFDTTSSPKSAHDDHYITSVQDDVRITVQRVGPDNEYTSAHAQAWLLAAGAAPFAANVGSNASNTAYSFQNLSITANTQYTLSVWVKTSGVTVGNGVRLLYGAHGNLHYTAYTAGTQDWTLVTLTFTSPSDTVPGAIQIIYDLRSGETAWVDDVSLVPTAGGTDAVTNGGMESQAGGTPSSWSARTAVSWDNTVAHSGSASMKIVGAAGVFSIDFASADTGAFAGLLVADATYTITDGGPLSQIDATVSNGDGSITGTLSFDTINRFATNSQRLVSTGTLTIAPTSDLAVSSGQLLNLLTVLTAGSITAAWTGSGTNLPASTPTTLPLGTILGVNSGVVAALRIDALTCPAVLGSTMTALRTTTRTASIYVTAPGNGTWATGDPLVVSFTILGIPVSETAANVAALLASYAPGAAIVTVGTPAAYSLALLHAQMVYYEGKSWDWVESYQLAHGWGKSWNIAWRHSKNDDTYDVAHDNDSSMGNGFLLYAASLKAVMTGESRYYSIADALANYFIQLELEDIAEYPNEIPSVAGRIPHFYNGGPGVANLLNTPAGMCVDESSSDQMSTVAMGLWAYAHLNTMKIAYHSEVVDLLGRMALYLQGGGPNVTPSAGLMNLGLMLGLPGFSTWLGTQLDPNPLGGFYSQWLLGNTVDLNTGASDNTFFVGRMSDTILPSKDATKLLHRTSYMLHDAPTSARGLYPVIHGTSYTATWGQDEWEFPVIGRLQTVTDGLTPTYTNVGRGGLSGRASEGAAALAYAITDYPSATVTVQLDDAYMPVEEFVRHIIHAAMACSQDDFGAICEAAVGTLGTASNVTWYKQTTDENAYFLLAIALYHLTVLHDTTYPCPASGHDYVQGVSESFGATTVWLLGDTTLAQEWSVPDDRHPILCSGILATPTLTFAVDGTATELAGNVATINAAMTLHDYASGTVQALPVEFTPVSGTILVTPLSWGNATGGTLSIVASAGQEFDVLVSGFPVGQEIEVIYADLAFPSVADGAGDVAVSLTAPGSGALILIIEFTLILPPDLYQEPRSAMPPVTPSDFINRIRRARRDTAATNQQYSTADILDGLNDAVEEGSEMFWIDDIYSSLVMSPYQRDYCLPPYVQRVREVKRDLTALAPLASTNLYQPNWQDLRSWQHRPGQQTNILKIDTPSYGFEPLEIHYERDLPVLFFQSTLATAVTSTARSILYSDAVTPIWKWPVPGYLKIDNELIRYETVSQTAFLQLTRGALGSGVQTDTQSVGAAHAVLAQLEPVWFQEAAPAANQFLLNRAMQRLFLQRLSDGDSEGNKLSSSLAAEFGRIADQHKTQAGQRHLPRTLRMRRSR